MDWNATRRVFILQVAVLADSIIDGLSFASERCAKTSESREVMKLPNLNFTFQHGMINWRKWKGMNKTTSQQGSLSRGQQAFCLVRCRKLSNLLWHYYCVIRSSAKVKSSLSLSRARLSCWASSLSMKTAETTAESFLTLKTRIQCLARRTSRKRVEFKVRKLSRESRARQYLRLCSLKRTSSEQDVKAKAKSHRTHRRFLFRELAHRT